MTSATRFCANAGCRSQIEMTKNVVAPRMRIDGMASSSIESKVTIPLLVGNEKSREFQARETKFKFASRGHFRRSGRVAGSIHLPQPGMVLIYLTCQAPKLKIFRFTGILVYGIDCPVLAHMRDVSRSSRHVGRRMRWT